MGREVRRVPANWEHPKNDRGFYIPMYPGSFFDVIYSDWLEANDPEFQEPKREDFMPLWHDHEKTHLMMYEDTSEGTPISPAFATPEELAKWLADNNASSMGNRTATYDQWLNMIVQYGFSISAVYVPGKGMISGVEYDGD